MNIIKCPVCDSALDKHDHSYQCKNKHTFDIASKGYVHLLPANRKNSKEPGDNRQMVLARNAFLNAGYFQKLSKAINSLVLKSIREKQNKEVCILDSGCGEGYYIDALERECTSQKIHASFFGIDISKEAIRVASSRNKNVFFAVASSFEIPVMNGSVDCLMQVFAPCSDEEFHRILRQDGILISVIPGKKHLFGLKEALYENPYENDEMEHPLSSFTKVKQIRVEYEITINEPEHIRHLFMMTPYYWRTSAEKMEELNNLRELCTPSEFIITIYAKK